MLTVHAEGALLLMSDSQGVKILKIYYRELVIHSNLVVICECQGIDISGSKGETDSEVHVDIQRELIWHWRQICFMKQDVWIIRFTSRSGHLNSALTLFAFSMKTHI